MEQSFDFGRLLRNHAKKHKSKPTQFVSVAGGVQKRLEDNLKCRKSSRLTVFDSVRNLSTCPSPAPMSEAHQKMEHRRQQLEKWKEEKEKKKKVAASQKKKPFVAGVPQLPLKFVPPPPPPVKPSTSGRVTRSQTARNSKQTKEKQINSQSFAPNNASFKPPQMKNQHRVPYVNLVALKPVKSKLTVFTFDPVLPKIKQDRPVNEVKQTGTRTQNKDSKVTQLKPDDIKSKAKTTSPMLKDNTKMPRPSCSETDSTKSLILSKYRKSLPTTQTLVSQSTSTETDSSGESPVLSKSRKAESHKIRTRKSVPAANSPILVSKTPKKSTPKSLQSVAVDRTPKNPVPKSESSSEERLRSPKDLRMSVTPEQIVQSDQRISPFVTISRGKDNARREMKKKLEEGLLDEDASNTDNIDIFRRQLASEIKRMTEMCETWDRISEQTALPDTIQECILSAVGQARLLMSQKLQQFATLIERCARPEPGTALVTAADLHGFWDMVFMQVENVDMRFKKLEGMRARGWTEEKVVVITKDKPAKVMKAKPVGGASRLKDQWAKPVGGASRLKEMIAAARKAKKDHLPAGLSPSPAEKSFEAGFFCVTSPVRSPAPHQPGTPINKQSLLKAVLSSEAKKSASKNSASFAMLRASVLAKSNECDGIAPLPQTPLQPLTSATPGRSILKKATADTATKKLNKSAKVVLFDQSDNDIDTSQERDPIGMQDKERPIGKENVLEEIELNAGSGPSLMNLEKEVKASPRRKSHRFTQQDTAEDFSPVKTRSRRKSNSTSQEKTKRSTRKSKVLEAVETNVLEEQTPRRTSRRRRDIGLLENTT